MTREEAKQLLPIIQAYAEGKTIQVKLKTDSNALCEKWVDVKNPDFDIYECYRIKPEPIYRPFNSAKECWQEMQKHQPSGWVKYRSGGLLMNIISIGAGITVHNNTSNCGYSFKSAFSLLTFADGTPFGIKEGTDD